MGRITVLAYGALAYIVFFATFLFAIAFVGNLGPWKTIDSGFAGSPSQAILVDLALLALFAVQHSVMARPAFKRAWVRVIPKSIERSTYVLAASLALIVLIWQWRPILTPIWSISGAGGLILQATFWLGWALLLLSTFLLNHFELFGLSQVYSHMRSLEAPAPVFRTPSLYRVVRHPLYLGFVIAFWSAPAMTGGHLLFSLATTGYILLGIFFEERDLMQLFGEQYRSYRNRVSMLLPMPRRKASAAKPASR
jgi:protein-S-isoprenylcysteine O-methyltransferase Ste14